MAAEDVEIVAYDPAAPTDRARAVIFTRSQRSGLTWSSAVPGGDAKASWTVNCAVLGDTGFPKGKARVLIQDPVRGTYLWRGVLQTPTLHYERGKLTSVDYTATGCAEASWRQFDETLVFGVTDVLATVNGRESVTNLGEIMAHGLTICPLIDGSQAGIATGGVLTEDTRDYKGSSAPQLWEDVCNLTRGLSTPFIWLVEPDEDGLAALRFLAQPSAAEYFERGLSRENTLEIDYGEIANRVYGIYKGYPTIKDPPDGDPIDETQTPDIQTHTVDLSTDFIEYTSAAGFVSSMLVKFNQRLVTGGSLVLDRDIRALYTGSSTPELIPITEVRAGKVVEVDVTKTPYLEEVRLGIFMTACAYNEDACTTTLSATAINEAGKNARIIASRAEGSKIDWAWRFRGAHSPHADLQKIHEAGHDAGAWSSGIFGTLVPEAPWVSRAPGSGYSYDAGGVVTAFDPNSVPPPYNAAVPADATMPVVVRATVPFVKTRDGFFGFGHMGGKIAKDVLPPDRVNFPIMIGTNDEDGDLTDGERAQVDVQEGWIDTFTVSVLNAIVTTVTVKVDIWNWDDEAIRVADAFELTITANTHGRFQFDNSDEDHRPVHLYHGDQLRWKVEDAADAVILCCALSGDKDHREMPTLIGPDWLPGNG